MMQIVLGHRSLAVRPCKRTRIELEENVSSVLYGNPTQSKRMCITPVEVEEKKAQEPEEKTEDKKKACDITINFNLNSRTGLFDFINFVF